MHLFVALQRYNNILRSTIVARDKTLQLIKKGMSKRKAEETAGDTMAATAEKLPQNDFIIGLEDPLKDYQKLIETRVQVDEIVDDDITKENFNRTAQAAREVIWRLLFDDSAKADDDSGQQKATQLLEDYRGDASFYDPLPYNSWIVELRDELLKRELLDFWRENIVKRQLGPCWSRDCDLFDSDDTPPLEFYAHAGCTAPFAASLKVRAAFEHQASLEQGEQPSTPGELSADDAAALSGEFEAVLTKENPLEEYRTLMKRFVLTKIVVPDTVHNESVKKVAAAAREIIWKLLFDGVPSQADQDKAADLLQEYKGDAGFYGPQDYNEWIVKLRDEVITRELLDFWCEKMVKLELGPSCARDSDYYDSEDPLPLEFYEKAGCKAPFEAN